jgi:hypothetical protein
MQSLATFQFAKTGQLKKNGFTVEIHQVTSYKSNMNYPQNVIAKMQGFLFYGF